MDNIKLHECPYCESQIDEIKRWGKHCNGQWNESVKFKCGHFLHWSPNFKSIDESHMIPCPKTEVEIEKKQKRKKALELLLRYINRMNVDKQWKIRIIKSVQYDLNIPIEDFI